MAPTRPLIPGRSRRGSTSASRARIVICALIVLILLASIGGVLGSVMPAHASGLQESQPGSSTPENSASTGSPEPPASSDPGNDSEPASTQSDPAEDPSTESDTGPTPIEADRQAVTIACTPGTVYSVSGPGQLQQVAPNGTVTNLGTPPSGTITQLNGLGIGTGGTAIYAFDRTNSFKSATIYSFNPATEQWSNTGTTYNTSLAANGGFNGSLVAGAVDLSARAGTYYFGGFTSNGAEFKLWRYDPGTRAVTYLGFVDTSEGSGSASNGDIAFDAQGNLFIARGVGATTTIFSVTRDSLAAANGGQITAAGSRGVSTIANVSGIAFDAAGKAYLGSGTTVTSYDMPNWTNNRTVTTGLTQSTDLASCSSPVTITLEKDVQNRVGSGDQFGLSLAQGSTVLGTATTSGTANGVQSQRVGPLPVTRGTTIQFSETAAGTTDLSKYASSYRCLLDGQQMSVAGEGTSASVTIPATGEAIVCRIVNSPLTANVTINKQTQNAQGGDQRAAAGWTVGAAPTAASGTVTQSPTAQTQTTDGSGNASWTLTFNAKSASARLAVWEQQQANFDFASGSCRITRLDGTSVTVSLTGADRQTLSSSILPGDDVRCGYVNKLKASDLTVNKTWVVDGQRYANGSQPDGLSAALTLDPAGSPAGTPTFGQKRTGFSAGDTVRIGETTTIDSAKFPGCTLRSRTISGSGITGTVPLTDGFSTQLPAGSNTYEVTNTVECQSLTIVKSVTNDNGGALTPADWNQRLFATPSGGARLTFDSGEKKYVPTGSFVISETTQPGYEQVSIRCTGATFNAATSTISLTAGQSAVCTVTNDDTPGTAAWGKTDESGRYLKDSEWTLRGPGGSAVAVVDCVAASADQCTGPDTDPAAGKFLVKDLRWGDYTLVETRAPAGFVLDQTERKFSITRDRLDYRFDAAFVNRQAASPQMPMTGGTGTIGFVIAGAALLLGGAAGAYWQLRRRRYGRS